MENEKLAKVIASMPARELPSIKTLRAALSAELDAQLTENEAHGLRLDYERSELLADVQRVTDQIWSTGAAYECHEYDGMLALKLLRGYIINAGLTATRAEAVECLDISTAYLAGRTEIKRFLAYVIATQAKSDNDDVRDVCACVDGQMAAQVEEAPEAVEIVETATYTVDDGTQHIYSARVGAVEVGSASVILYDDGDAYIERIDVDDGYRNRGYGTAMLKQLAAEYGNVYLAPDNEDARRLYARLGDDVTSVGAWGYVDQGFGVYAITA